MDAEARNLITKAAAYCRCKPRTLRYWRGLNLGLVIILVGDLDAWIEQRRQQMAQAV